MSQETRSIHLQLRVNFITVLGLVVLLHSLLIYQELSSMKLFFASDTSEKTPLRIRSIETNTLRKIGTKKGDKKIDAFASFRKYAPEKNDERSDKKPKAKKEALSLSDLAAAQPQKTSPSQRPGTLPKVAAEKPKAISAISLRGKEIQEFMKSSPSSAMSGDPRASKLSASDILVNLEVPEGVEADELNKYELMFYGFQRRTAINYINAFYKNLDKFQRENPHLNFPMTDSKQVMTGRLTYDEKGNIKQIKMVRWSNEDRLQDFFESVLKDMDTLQNPPQALWQKNGEFSIFFSFIING